MPKIVLNRFKKDKFIRSIYVLHSSHHGYHNYTLFVTVKFKKPSIFTI